MSQQIFNIALDHHPEGQFRLTHLVTAEETITNEINFEVWDFQSMKRPLDLPGIIKIFKYFCDFCNYEPIISFDSDAFELINGVLEYTELCLKDWKEFVYGKNKNAKAAAATNNNRQKGKE
jgi:hypothetical protein